MSESVEQAVRKSHCSRKGEGHECVGTCTISPKGIHLSCPLCGTDDVKMLDCPKWVTDRARAILNASGLDYNALSVDYQIAVLNECGKDRCGGCGSMVLTFGRHTKCKCGWAWHEYLGWKKPN